MILWRWGQIQTPHFRGCCATSLLFGVSLWLLQEKKAAETFITRFTASLIDATYISVGERPSRPPCSSTLCDILRSEQLVFATRIFRRRSRRKAAIIAVKTVNKPLSISARSIRQSQSAACVLRASVSLDAGKTAHARKVSTHPTPGFEKSPLHADVESLLAKF